MLATALLACAPLLGCASRSPTVALPPGVPDAFTVSGSEALPDRWWTLLRDPRLDAAVDRSLATNLDLKAAWERLRAAEALAGREAGGLFPTLDGTARAESRDGSRDIDRGEELELGLAARYEIDLWGRIRSGVDAERYRARATGADYRTAALSLSAEVVRTWCRLAEARAQLVLVDEQTATNETVLALLKNRFGTGQIRGVDILRQRQLVAARREQRGYALSRIALLEHRLAVLAGQPPQDGPDAVPERLPDLPPLPATGVPLDLVRRRPDVQRAFALVQAADRDLATAVSARYPRLSLSAGVATAGPRAGDLFDGWVSSLVGNLVAPLFRGGELKQDVRRGEALRRRSVYEYGQTVLTAFREVEDALILETNQRESLARLEEQVDLARQSYDRLRSEYFNGTSNYLDVLTSLDEVQRLRRDLLSARLVLLEYRIALYRALAGSLDDPIRNGA